MREAQVQASSAISCLESLETSTEAINILWQQILFNYFIKSIFIKSNDHFLLFIGFLFQNFTSKIINNGKKAIFYFIKFQCLKFLFLDKQINSSMKKNTGMVSMQELQKYSLINNLKLKIEELKQVVRSQEDTIEQYKRSTKTTIINEQEIEIQKLNDENKRLLLLIEDLKEGKKDLKGRQSKTGKKQNWDKERKELNLRNKVSEVQENILHEERQTENVFQTKYYNVLLENQLLKKKLMTFKTSESTVKRKTSINDRSSILIEKNINESDRVKQKSYEIEAELNNCQERERKLRIRVQELESLLEKSLQISTSMKALY